MTTKIPSQAKFNSTLSNTLKGSPVISNATCEFEYNWDFSKNMGLAHLISIDNCNFNITLHPLGISGMLGFMSDIPPTPVVINGQRVVLYRIILDIDLKSGERKAAIMFNEDGSTIQTSPNWNNTNGDMLKA